MSSGLGFDSFPQYPAPVFFHKFPRIFFGGNEENWRVSTTSVAATLDAKWHMFFFVDI